MRRPPDQRATPDRLIDALIEAAAIWAVEEDHAGHDRTRVDAARADLDRAANALRDFVMALTRKHRPPSEMLRRQAQALGVPLTVDDQIDAIQGRFSRYVKGLRP